MDAVTFEDKKERKESQQVTSGWSVREMTESKRMTGVATASDSANTSKKTQYQQAKSTRANVKKLGM